MESAADLLADLLALKPPFKRALNRPFQWALKRAFKRPETAILGLPKPVQSGINPCRKSINLIRGYIGRLRPFDLRGPDEVIPGDCRAHPDCEGPENRILEIIVADAKTMQMKYIALLAVFMCLVILVIGKHKYRNPKTKITPSFIVWTVIFVAVVIAVRVILRLSN